MHPKCHCNSVCDFLCSCEGKENGLCRIHVQSHLAHKSLMFLPTARNKSCLNQLIKELDNEKEKIKDTIALTNCVIQSLIETLNEKLQHTMNTLNDYLSQIENFSNKLQNLDSTPQPFINAYQLIFRDSLQGVYPIFSFNQNDSQLFSDFKNLFTFRFSLSDLLVQGINICPERRECIEESKKKILEYSKLKKIFIRNKSENFIKFFYEKAKDPTSHFSSLALIHSNNSHTDSFEALMLTPSLIASFYGISFMDCKYTDDQIARIADFLTRYKGNCLNLRFRDVLSTIKQVEMISEALSLYKSIVSLDFSFNCIGEEGLVLLKNNLKSFSKLQYLNLSGNYLTASSAKHLNESLLFLKSLKILKINDNQLGDEGFLIISEGISALSQLEVLMARTNFLSAQGIFYLCNSVYRLFKLSVLDVAFNSGYDEGALILAFYLKSMHSLSVLNVEMMISPECIGELITSAQPHLKITAFGPGIKKKIKARDPIYV